VLQSPEMMRRHLPKICSLASTVSQVGKADATGLDPVEEADMNNSKTTRR